MNIKLDEKRMLDTFIKLLQIPSMSQHEKDVASYVKEWCNELDIEVIEDNTTNVTGSNVGNLICFIKGTCERAEPVLFTAHMDTIESKQVEPFIQNGYVQTNGTTALGADDKAGISALLEAVHYLKETNQKYGDIQLIFTVCEEQGLIGARSFNKGLIRGNFGYTIDADEPVGTLITHSPAISVVTITVFTHEQHPGNEVHETIARIIRSISKNPIEKDVHLSIIGFQENSQKNKGAIDLTIELKSLSSEKIHSYINILNDYAQEVIQSRQVSYSLEVEQICSNYMYGESDQIIKVPTKAAEKIGLPITHIKRLDVSDANVFTSHNTPIMNIGVGYVDIHTKQERMLISQLYDLTRFIIAITLTIAIE